jgi:small-conductance mechanosensitive channel
MSDLGFTALHGIARTLVGIALVSLVVRLLRRWPYRNRLSSADEVFVAMVLGTAAPLGYLAAILWGWRSLLPLRQAIGLGPQAERLVQSGALLLAIVLVVRLLNRALLRLVERSLRTLGQEKQIATLRGLDPMIRTFFWLLGALVFLQSQGVPLTAVYASLAGAGIGVGLALKGPVANFINYLTILFDQPFEIGQLIRFSDVVATVERVGMRSSSLRSLDGERIVINNEDLLNQTIRNYGDLTRRRLVHRIGVDHGTPVDKVAEISSLIEQLIRATPDAQFERCHLTRLGDNALEFELVYFVPGSDYSHDLDVQQRVNLEILRSFAQEGIELSVQVIEPRIPLRALSQGPMNQASQGLPSAAGTLAEPGL